MDPVGWELTQQIITTISFLGCIGIVVAVIFLVVYVTDEFRSNKN